MVLKKLRSKRYNRTKQRAHEQQGERSGKERVARDALEDMFTVDDEPLPTNEMEQCLAEFNKADNNHHPRRSSIKDLKREVDKLRKSASKSAKEKD